MGEQRSPKLEIKDFAGVVEDGHELTVDGQPLTPEEAEACAVLVACMRRGWEVEFLAQHGELAVRGILGITPSDAYLAALEATDE